MYNSYDFGGFLSYQLGPERKIMMDGRYIFFPLLNKEFSIQNRILTSQHNNEWAEFLQHYNVDYAITKTQRIYVQYPKNKIPFSLALTNIQFPRSEWALVYWDDKALVFLKRIPKFQNIIERYEYVNLWPYNLYQMEYLLNHNLISKKSVEEELQRHNKETGYTNIGQKIMALIS